MSEPHPSTVVLLGAQRYHPTLRTHVAALGLKGRIAIVTAGWQERESEDAELVAELGGRVVNLHLHARGEQVFKADRELADAHRERQDALRHMQTLYRLWLERALDAEQVVGHANVPTPLRDEARVGAIDAVRHLDRWHLEQCSRVRAEYDAKLHPFDRTSVQKHRVEIAKLLDECEVLVIAGGHVAVLVNRLLMFGIPELIGTRAVLAWSGGAMAVTDRVVLFHDTPPQGRGACEVLDRGIGLVPGVVVFPEPEQRLELDSAERVSLSARRFAPARCLVMPGGTSATYRSGMFVEAEGARVLDADGRHMALDDTHFGDGAGA